MSLTQVVLLAIVQGLTEFLPISSSAHLALAPWLLGWEDQGLAFDIALHFGTLLAVVLYFFRDWLQILAQGLRISYGSDADLKKSPNLLWLLAAASLPIGFFGYLFKQQAETTLRQPLIIGTMLIVIALFMEWSERRGRRRKGIGHVTLADAMAVGAAQAVAIIPGTSRSGITIATGLLRNLERPAAARFSFLLSTPAIAAAAAKAFLDLRDHGGIPPDMFTPFLLGIALSAASGCLAIGFLMAYLRGHTLRLFVHYRLFFGIMVIALAIFRR